MERNTQRVGSVNTMKSLTKKTSFVPSGNSNALAQAREALQVCHRIKTVRGRINLMAIA